MDIREERRESTGGGPVSVKELLLRLNNNLEGNQKPLDGPVNVKGILTKLNDSVEYGQKRLETDENSKKWKFPFKWQNKFKKSSKSIDKVVVLYLNIKGEIEPPMIQPIYSGNMVIIRHKPYEIDPRAFWTVKIGVKQYKILLIKEIDRRPVSNLDYTEIKRRGDATDSDEFLIKAALKAQTTAITGKTMKTALIIGILAVVALAVWYFIKG